MGTPRMTLLVPVRGRLVFTTNILPTAIRNAERKDHDIVLVVDACPLEHETTRRPETCGPGTLDQDHQNRARVRAWIDSHQGALADHGVRVVESPGSPQGWTGGLRTAMALNLAASLAKTEWIVGPGDEELCFLDGWDKALWNVLEGRDPQATVGTLVVAKPMAREVWPQPLVPSWVHMQRDRHCYQLALPVSLEHMDASAARISETSWRAFARVARLGGVYDEACGERRMCHWIPMLMHRDLLARAGGWPTDDDAAFSYDIKLDDRLRGLGAKKRMRMDSLALHSAHHLFISEDVDREWADPGVIEALGGKPVL